MQRVEIRVTGATMSDANPPGIVAGAQYAQVSPTPILTQDTIDKIVRDHGSKWTNPQKGRFTGKYATEEGIRTLIEDLWKTATPDDLAASYRGRVVIAASSYEKIDGVVNPDYVGFSGDITTIKEPTGQWGTAVRQDKPIRCHTRLGHAGYNVLSYKSLGPEESTKSLRRLNGDAMQVKLKNITGIASPKVEQFDLHEEFGVTCLVEAGERVTLYFNKITCRSWLKQEHPHIVNIKWFDINTVILYYDEIGAAIVSMESWSNIRLGVGISYLFQIVIYSFPTMKSLFSGPGLAN